MIYNLLIVTDHTTHAPSNSLYDLAKALTEDHPERNVWVCSKGIMENNDFFNGIPDAPIYATPVNHAFLFHPEGMYLYQSSGLLNRQDLDAIFVRMPQPLDKRFLQSLEKIVPAEKIINSPEGTIETSSKAFLLEVAHLCPSPSICKDINDAIILSQDQEIVLKPLYSYGGKGIIRLSHQFYWEGDRRFPADMISAMLTERYFPMVAMKFLPNVSLGDKRTIVVNQQIVGSAVRLPPPDSWICNVAHGGQAALAEPDEQELIIEQELTPLLFQKGVIMYGFDTLVNDEGYRVLSEINTLSIGGISPMDQLSGKPILKQAAALLWNYLEKS